MQALRFSALATSLIFLSVSSAQTPEQHEPRGADAAQVPVDVFHEAKRKSAPAPEYPTDARYGGSEGWVNLRFMVDKDGLPYEMFVKQSNGNKDFDKAALRSVRRWTFEPASLNGQPVDSVIEIKIIFRLTDHANGARPNFVTAYRSLYAAIAKNDRAAADLAMSKLQVDNLYEDAHFGLAYYAYAHKWGTPSEEITGLRRAIASEQSARYLPKDVFAKALTALFILEFQSYDFAAAMCTWQLLEKAQTDEKVLAGFAPAVQQMNTLHADAASYKVAGEIIDGRWDFDLFKKHFQIVVLTGAISEIKLRCDKSFVSFKFDPELQYKVADKFGRCSIELIGDPNTKFNLVQS